MAAKNHEPQTPTSLPNVNPPEVAGAGQTRVIVEAVKESVAELRSDVRAIKEYRFTDLLWHVGALAAGVVLLVGMMVAAYFKIDDKIQALSDSTRDKFEAASNATTRIETRLDDLLQRIPPASAAPSATQKR